MGSRLGLATGTELGLQIAVRKALDERKLQPDMLSYSSAISACAKGGGL